MRKIKAIVKRPDEKYGHMTWIYDSLENLQKTVGGHIQTVPIGAGAILVCDEDGKLKGYEPNIFMGTPPLQDVVVGTFFVCGSEGEEFGDCPLTMPQWKKILEMWGNGR